MRGRNDGMHNRRVFLTVILAVVVLSVLSVYYGAFFKSHAQHLRASPVSEERSKKIWFDAEQIQGDTENSPELEDESTSTDPDSRDEPAVEDQQEVQDEKVKDLGRNQDANVDVEELLVGGDIKGDGGINEVILKTFPVCDSSYTEIIPCLDRQLQTELKLKLNLTVMEHYERHCPPPQRHINCLVPPPPNYQVPIRWPQSRDEVWQANVPHTFLALQKSDQRWMVVSGEKVRFPGGGTHFPGGADKYIAALAKMLKSKDGDLGKGGKIRTVLDVGCGVASFGAYLLPDVLAMSLAPNDVHENQIQFALERGIPATLGVLGTMRLPYPSKSFDLAHCSRCRIDWNQRGGLLLLEIDRVIRPGGFFVWSSPPAYREDDEDKFIWNQMSKLVSSMCWAEVAKGGQTVIWMKNSTKECYDRRGEGASPPVCSGKEDPDAAWQVPMKACITVKNYNGRRSLLPWPRRLFAPSPRLKDLGFSNKMFQTDSDAWSQRVAVYWKHLESVKGSDSIRNIMDMNAYFGGFAAALTDKPVWVMNVVPVSGPNTLTMVYDRGLIGSLHDWCESFSTYPRTYDMLHASNLLSDIDEQGCSLEDLLLEMDRLLRPTGFAIIRDKAFLVNQVKRYLKALHWDMWVEEIHAADDEISNSNEKILMARKSLWQPDDITAERGTTF